MTVVQDHPCDSRAGGVAEARETEDSGLPWLAAYTRPRFEFKVKDYCEERGIEAFLPTYQTWRQWSDRRKLLRLPLFPSYIFMRTGAGTEQRAVGSPGFLWFVRDQRGPVRVDTQELKAIRLLLISGLELDPIPSLSVGDEVEIVRGSLKGCRGLLEHKGPPSLILQISAIHSGVRVRVPDPSWIRRTV